MLIGGRTHVGMLNHVDWWKPSNKTFVYDFKDETWTSGPEMSYARAGLDCTSFNDEEDINWTIVSRGLYEFNGVAGFSQTEILEENSSNWTSVAYYQWTVMNPDARDFKMISFLDKVMLLGGREENKERKSTTKIFELEKSTNGQFEWILSDLSLTYPRTTPITVLNVPLSFVSPNW